MGSPVSQSTPDPVAQQTRRQLAVIGGGISGLAAAHRALELDPSAQVTLFEASGRLGGVLQTVRRDGWLIEQAADMFTTREPWALDLCRRIGIESELIETDARYRRAFVVHRGKLVPVPEGFTLMSPAKIWPIVKTPLLSPLGKLRLALEYFTPARRDNQDESLESFVVRRFGREAFERLVQPLIGGIYTADPAKLSLAATLPQFLEMERRHGSLIRGMRKQVTRSVEGRKSNVQSQVQQNDTRHSTFDIRQSDAASGARYGMFVAPRDGMQRMVEALAARLPAGCVQLNSRVERMERADDGSWRLQVNGAAWPHEFDDVVLAAPGAVSSRLLEHVDSELARLVGSIPHAGCAVVVLGCRRDRIAHPLDGFGIVAPAIENRKLIAASMASVKFAGRAPAGHVLLRVFVGGALQPELLQLTDEEIETIVRRELAELIGLADAPEFCDVIRWQGKMPQYHVGHLDLVRQIEIRAATIPHFALAGNAYRGVGVPFCVRSGEAAAARIFASS